MSPEISVDIWSLILAASAVQGLVMAVLLLRSGRSLKSNRFIAGLLLIIVWVQVEFLMVRTATEVSWNVFYGMRHGVWLAVGPFFFYYLRTSFEKSTFKAINYLHWLPFVLFTLCIPAVFAEAIPENGRYYGMLSVIRFSNEGLTPIQLFYLFLFFIQYLHAGAYGIACLSRIRAYKVTRESRLKRARRSWFKAYTIQLLILVLAATVYFIILFYSDHYQRWMDYMLIIPLVITTYALAINAFKKPYLFSDDVKPSFAREKYEKSGLTAGFLEAIHPRLNLLLEEEKLYRNAELRLADLAGKLGISTNETSQVINQKYGANFHELINGYRVNEAKDLLSETGNRQTVLEIAYQVGFNNKASFNRYFKQEFGKTPSQFRKEMKEKM